MTNLRKIKVPTLFLPSIRNELVSKNSVGTQHYLQLEMSNVYASRFRGNVGRMRLGHHVWPTK